MLFSCCRLTARSKAVSVLQRVKALPWGVGAAFRIGPVAPASGGPGVFFACRTAHGDRYWRFIEPDGTVLDAEGVILRRIDPGDAPGVAPGPGELDLEGAWARAVRHIVEEHNRRADPRAAEQAVGPVQQFALQLLRDPTVELPERAAVAEEALSVERSSLDPPGAR